VDHAYDIAAQVRLARALLRTNTVTNKLCRGVLLGAAMWPHERRFLYYLLKSAAERLTWLRHIGKVVLTVDEDRLCEMVERYYSLLERAGQGALHAG
jgi:hypothetical protein